MLNLENIQAVIASHKNQLDKFSNDLVVINVLNSKKRKSLESVQQLFDSVDKRIKKDTISTLRYVNVGGNVLSFDLKSVTSVTSNKSLFSLLSGKYDIYMPRDEKGRIFLDFDSNWIKSEFDLLRDLVMWDGNQTNCPVVAPISPLKCAQAEFVARCFTSSVMNATRSKIQDDLSKSLILSKFPVDSVSSLRDMLPTRQRSISSKLIYRSSRDGFTRSSFHACSKGHKNTLVVIEDTDGNVFGGYSDVEFQDEDSQYSSKDAFLFSLKKNGKYVPVKLVQRGSPDERSYAVWNQQEYLFAFGVGHDLGVTSSESDCNLGNTYEDLNRSRTLANDSCFHVAELELFSFDEILPTLNGHTDVDTKHITFTRHLNVDTDSELLQSSESLLNTTSRCHDQLKQSGHELTMRACALRDELYCVANFIGLTVPSVTGSNDKSNQSMMSDEVLFSCTVTEIENMIRLITVYNVNNEDVSGAKSIVYINAGGTVLAVSKATLLQAPSGSILANMASDVHGHDLDSDGNIIQDVNSVLFTAIINYLRLKALGAKMSKTDIPPIVIYAEQKNALKSLLAFYMLTDIPVREIKATKVETENEYVL